MQGGLGLAEDSGAFSLLMCLSITISDQDIYLGRLPAQVPPPPHPPLSQSTTKAEACEGPVGERPPPTPTALPLVRAPFSLF